MKNLRAFFGTWVGAVIALAAVIIVVTLLFALLYPKYVSTQKPTTYATKQECESATNKPCQYAICDYKCKVSYSGWMPVTKER